MKVSLLIPLAASLCIAAPAAAQGAQSGMSIEDMEKALGLGAAPVSGKRRYRAPTFESDAAAEPAGETAAPEAAAAPPARPMSFDVPIEFEFGSARVSPSYRQTIVRVAEVLRRNPGVALEIRGHTDAVGTDRANKTLSQQRAEVVRREIITLGIDGGRLSASGYGESNLLPGLSPEAADNRRVEFVRVAR